MNPDGLASDGLGPAPRAGSALVMAAAAGVGVGLGGTLLHRWQVADLPVGIVLAVLAVAVGSVLARALAGGRGVFVHLLASFLTAQALTFLRPGGDVLVAGQLVGYVWLVAQPVAALTALVTPRRWYVDDA